MGSVNGEPIMTRDIQGIWQEVHERLRVFIAKRVANQAEVEDLVQEVFLQMHRKLDSLKDPSRLVPWLFQVARHAVADYYRAPQRRREVPAGLAADMERARSARAVPMVGTSVDSDQLREELAGCLRPMIERLSGQYRKAVTLVELEGLTQTAAARQLGLSVSGTKSRVQRGRRQLKRMLDECCLIELDRRRSVTAYVLRDPRCSPCGPRPDPKTGTD
jgi:RNA polymerase sigma-70 factor (ECF subfamily)